MAMATELTTVAYRFLTRADGTALHHTFMAAFSDYTVDMRMSREQFEQRLVRDGVQLEMSVGAFDGEVMIGFCVNGHGDWQGKPTVYDSGTGIVPTHRSRGIGRELFNFMLPRLKVLGVNQYLLEVICTNAAAVNLYRGLGFRETRTFSVFRADIPLTQRHEAAEIEIRDVGNPDWRLYQSFWDGQPSWQNSVDAIQRLKSGAEIVGAYSGDACVGYGVVSPATANVMQLAVAAAHRRRGAGSLILAALQRKLAPSQPLKVNNIDHELAGSLAFCEANGLNPLLRQFEMMKTL